VQSWKTKITYRLTEVEIEGGLLQASGKEEDYLQVVGSGSPSDESLQAQLRG